MTLTWIAEPWNAYRADCNDLWREHYDELAARKDKMRMSPDEASYRASEEAGSLYVLVGREDGRMIGYLLADVRPHRHYSENLCCFEDAYFLTRGHRVGRTPVRMFQTWISDMKARNVDALFAMCKTLPGMDHSRLFEWLGFTKTDHCWSMWIGA